MVARKELVDLLLSLFSADELRRWLHYLDYGLAGRLPGPNASPMSLASEAVAELERTGLIDDEFWGRLIDERPRRRADIEQVRLNIAPSGGRRSEALVAPAAASGSAPGNAMLTVLLVSASPTARVRLRVDREFRDVIAKVKGSRHRDRFNFVQLQAARFEDLRTALLEHQPHVLHISAHGDTEGNLTFEGQGDASQLVTPRQLTRLLGALEGLRLVVLNACYSEVLAVQLPEICGLAIGMNDTVADQAAINFGVAFYEALGFGKSVEVAFALALAGLDEFDDNGPQLFPPPSQDPGNRRRAPMFDP